MSHPGVTNRPSLSMRLGLALLVACLLSTATGCQLMQLFRAPAPAVPDVFQAETLPSAGELVAAIQKNTAAVKQISSTVKVVMDGLPASVKGTLLMERPQRLRLKVGLLGMTDSGVDIGSNDERFWIYNKSSFGGQQPAIYYARHQDYHNSQLSRTLQLQPQWLIDAMGLLEIDTSLPIQGPILRDGVLEMVTTVPTPNGNMRRTLKLDPKSGIILQQAIYDSQNRLLAWARSSKHRYFPEHDASLPQHIQLTMVDPAGKQTSLSIDMLSYTINSLYVNPDVTWGMPNHGDVPQIDLTTIDPGSFQPLAQAPSHVEQQPDERKRPFRLGRLRGFNLR